MKLREHILLPSFMKSLKDEVDYSIFKPLKAEVAEIDMPKTKEKCAIIGDTKYQLLKSKEFVSKGYENISFPGIINYDESSY